MTAFMPISAPRRISQLSKTAPWPTVTPSPTSVGPRALTCRTQLSWMLVRSPIRIPWCGSSARSTAPNQTLDSAPITTSPMSTAVGAMNAVGCTCGVLPPNGMITMRLRPD
jgi:hypothetical protein